MSNLHLPRSLWGDHGEREREREGDGERERESGREGGRERISSRLHAVGVEPDAGLELMNHEIMA